MSEEHVVPLMVAHKKTNPELYKLVGLKERAVLTCDQMVSLVMRMTGSLGKAVNRTLREIGFDVASNAAVRRALNDAALEADGVRTVSLGVSFADVFPSADGARTFAVLRVRAVTEEIET